MAGWARSFYKIRSTSLLITATSRTERKRQEQAYDLFRGILGGFGRKKARPQARGRRPIPILRPGPGYRPNRKFVTPEEFHKLSDKGFIDPQRVRTSQDSFSNKFKKEYVEGRGEVRRTVDELAAEVKAGNDKDVPPIRLVEWKGFVYSPDHRRLVAYRRAGKDIQYVKTSIGELDKAAKDRIYAAANTNANGSFIRNRDTNLME